MIQAWSEVMSRYQSLKPTSRATKNLNEWGEILASAYMLDKNQANAMWQEIIDLNIRIDLTYAKYFAAQIFNKITDHLPLHDAVRFLYMTPSRVPLLYLNPYNACSFFNYCIIGHHIINGDMNAVVEHLRMLNKNNIEDDEEIQNSPSICNRFFSITGKLASKENSWHPQYEEATESLVIRVYEWCVSEYPNSRMAQLAHVHLLLLTDTEEPDAAQAVRLLRLCEDQSSSLYTDFLYLERNIIPKKKIKELLISYCQNHSHLPMDADDDASREEKAKARWYRHHFLETDAISRSILLRTTGWLHDEEEAYFGRLAKRGAWEIWVALLSHMILNGDASYSGSCARYVSSAIRDAKPPKVHDYGWFTFTISSGSDGEYSKLDDSQKIEFTKALAMLCYGIRLSDECNNLCEETLAFIDEIESIRLSLPRIHSARALQEYGKYLIAAKPNLLEEIRSASVAKEASIQAEKDRKEAEFQRRAANLYESLLYSSPYKVLHSAFMKSQETSDHFSVMMDSVLKELTAYLKNKGIELSTFICNMTEVCSVHLTDKDGNIERDTAMIVPRSDEEFSEYVLRYTEALFRERVNYPRVNFPEVPASDKKAKYFSFPSGAKGYYRCVNESDQPSLIKHDPNIYSQVRKIANNVVQEYFEKCPSILATLKDTHEHKPQKTILEEIEGIINAGTDSESTLASLIDTFRNTTPTNKKTKAKVISSLIWDYWVLNDAASSKVKYKDFPECFPNVKWELAYKKAILDANYAAAYPYFAGFYSVTSKRLRDSDEPKIKKCIIASMYAADKLCRSLNIDPKELFLGKWTKQSWKAFSVSSNITISTPRTVCNVGDVVVYNTVGAPICETYERTEAQASVIRYILKLVESTYLDLFALPQKNGVIEKLDDLFDFERYSEFVDLLPATIIAATSYAATCDAELVISNALPTLEVSSNQRTAIETCTEIAGTSANTDRIMDYVFKLCFAMDVPKAIPDVKPYDCFEINFEAQTYRDFLTKDYVSDKQVIQEQNKQVLTRFYQLYDSYCAQLQAILDMPIKYDAAFSYTVSKLRKAGGGFVGKDLYQLPQIVSDGRDFCQWIARIECGEVIFPDFQPYIPLLYYFIINDRLFANRRDLGLVVMCKMWNHYCDEMPAQDVSLILGWIKDYWMIYCQNIPLTEFKHLFDRKIVFLNEPTVDILNCNTVLEYFNEICFYRVLHGKLVTKGHRKLFEDIFEVVNKRIAAVWSEYGLSYESMLYQAAGKNTYVFLRAIVTRDVQYQIASQPLERRVSSDEEYILNENEKTLRLQWEFVTPKCDVAFIKAFMEYSLKLTEYRIRVWLGYSSNDSFNVDASAIYKFEQKDPTVRKLLLDNQDAGRIERIIYETVAEICEAKGVVQKGYYEPFAVFHGSDDYTSDALLAEEEKLDYEGIDPNQRITGKSLEEARLVLLRNQGKLVIEDEEDKPDVAQKPTTVTFDSLEIKLLRILIYSNNVAFELQNLMVQNIVPSVLITKINEKAMDLIGDVLIDEDQSPPSIYEDYVEMIQEVLESNE